MIDNDITDTALALSRFEKLLSGNLTSLQRSPAFEHACDSQARARLYAFARDLTRRSCRLHHGAFLAGNTRFDDVRARTLETIEPRDARYSVLDNQRKVLAVGAVGLAKGAGEEPLRPRVAGDKKATEAFPGLFRQWNARGDELVARKDDEEFRTIRLGTASSPISAHDVSVVLVIHFREPLPDPVELPAGIETVEARSKALFLAGQDCRP